MQEATTKNWHDVKARLYRHKSTQLDVELSCVAINGPLIFSIPRRVLQRIRSEIVASSYRSRLVSHLWRRFYAQRRVAPK